jgi:hypothetical protein
MSNNKMRVNIPRNAEDTLSLASAIHKKHLADGANSPLKLLADTKWDTEGPKIAQAQAKHIEAEVYKSKMEAAYRERDLIMANIPNIIRSTRDLLAGINSSNMKRLAEWGFSVESSAAPKSKNDSNSKSNK